MCNCNPCSWFWGKKRRKKRRRRNKQQVGKIGHENTQITSAPQALSLRMPLISADGAKIQTGQVTITFEVPFMFATVEQVIAAQGFEIYEELGKGAYGTVYKAKRMRDALWVACKVMSMADQHSSASAKNELYVLERISERAHSHPNIIKLFKHFIVKTNTTRKVITNFIAMQIESPIY